MLNKKYITIFIALISLFFVSCEAKTEIVIEQSETSKKSNVIDARDNMHLKGNSIDIDTNQNENNIVRFECTSPSFLPLIAKLNEKYNGMTEIDAENAALKLYSEEYAFNDFSEGNVDILFAYEPLKNYKASFIEYIKVYGIEDANVIMLGKDGIAIFYDIYDGTYECEYYYYKNMLNQGQHVLKDVNGILPNEENILNGTYPNIVNFYMIVKNNYMDNEKLNDIVSFLSGDEGKEFMKSLSYCVS